MAKVALVGGSHIHTPNFAKVLSETDGIETARVWDPDADTAKRRQEVSGGEIVEDPQAIFDDDSIDAVIICSQTDRHESLVMPAAKAGKHIFVEKPLGMGADDAQRMAEAIRKANVLFQTGYFMRGNPQVRFVRDALQNGTFGRLTRIRLSNCHSGVLKGMFDTEFAWMADPAQAGCGGFGDLGTHVLDLLLWITEGDHVRAATASVGNAVGRYGNVDEYGEGQLRLASGAIGTIAAGWVDLANPNFLEVSGTEGHARITNKELYVTSENIDGADGQTPWTQLAEPWPHAFVNFLSAIKGEDHPPLVTVDEALARNQVMEALYTGAQQGQWISPAS